MRETCGLQAEDYSRPCGGHERAEQLGGKFKVTPAFSVIGT